MEQTVSTTGEPQRAANLLATRYSGTILDRLDDQRRAEAINLASKLKIDPSSSGMSIGNWAVAPQRKLSSSIDQVLQVSSLETGPVGEALTHLQTQLRSLDTDSLTGYTRGVMAGIPILNRWFDALEAFIHRYESVGRKLGGIVNQIEKQKGELIMSVARTEALEGENDLYRKELQLYIAAGEIKLKDMRSELEQMLLAAEGDPEKQREARNFGRLVDALDKRIYNLKLMEVTSLQTSEALAMVREASQELLNQIQDAILMVIPNWKLQAGVAVGAYNLRKGRELTRALRETNNELMLGTARLLRTEIVETAKETQHGVVEIATLQQVTRDLIAAINDAERIRVEGRNKRMKAIVEIEGFKRELGQAFQAIGASA